LKNEVIIPKGHRFVYDHAVRNVGIRLVEAGNREELLSSINEKTAMLFYLNNVANKRPITREELVEAGKAKGVPTLIDAAADLPPAKNLTAFLEMGFDLVAFTDADCQPSPAWISTLVAALQEPDVAGVKGVYGPGTPIPASAKDVQQLRKSTGAPTQSGTTTSQPKTVADPQYSEYDLNDPSTPSVQSLATPKSAPT
jgi:methylmalonyl-CoA mutase cobalamin-binding subunit